MNKVAPTVLQTTTEKFWRMLEPVTEKFDVFKKKCGHYAEVLCDSMVERPRTHCCFHWSMILLVTILVLATGKLSFVDTDFTDFLIHSQQDVKNHFALQGAENLAGENRPEGLEINSRSVQLLNFGVLFLYEHEHGSQIFTPDNLRVMCEVEHLAFDSVEYPFYCPTTFANGSSTVCDAQQSSLSFIFYESGLCGISLGSEKCPTLDAEDIQCVVDFLIENGVFRNFVDREENPTVARSIIFAGGPLGPDSPPNEKFDQPETVFRAAQGIDGYARWMESYEEGLFEYFDTKNRFLKPAFAKEHFSTDDSTLLIRTDSGMLEVVHFNDILIDDEAISIFSFVVVMVIVAFYVNSLILSFLSMLAIAASMMVGLFLFANVLQIEYFTNLNILVLFIIAGIGADNVLVLVDAWKQSEEEVIEIFNKAKAEGRIPKDRALPVGDDLLKKRLGYAYERAILSVMHTASTTFVSFLANTLSPIAPIAGLGLYAALVILANLFYMFTVHPANLIFHHYCFIKGKEEFQDEAFWKSLKCWKSSAPVKEEKEVPKDVEDAIPKSQGPKSFDSEILSTATRQGWLDKGFDYYLYLMNETYFAKIALLSTSVLAVVMLSSAAQLGTPAEVEGNFKEGHMFYRFSNDFQDEFTQGSEDAFTAVDAVFGISGFDASGVKKFSKEEVQGAPVFDPNFDISTKAGQDEIINTCDAWRTAACTEKGCNETLIIPNTLECVLENYRDALGGGGFIGDGNITNKEEFLDAMVEFLKSDAGNSFVDDVGIIDGEVRFIKLAARMTMKTGQALATKQPVIERFNDFADEVNKAAELGFKNYFQTSFDHIWQHTEEAFITSLFQGMGISLVCSYFVLLIGTGSGRVALFAILGVAAVVGSVLGTVRFQGWDLGTAESIAGVMVIGLAVDYIVHLGHMFMHSVEFLNKEDERNSRVFGTQNPAFNNGSVEMRGGSFEEKRSVARSVTGSVTKSRHASMRSMRERPASMPESMTPPIIRTSVKDFENTRMVTFAVKKMGPTILGGAVTTFCSAIFLSLCTFAFFGKMSILILLTIVYSTAYAFLFFVPLLRIFGPGK